MELALMRYKGISLWCNPVSVEITTRRLTSDYTTYGYGEIHSDIGAGCAVIKGVLELRGEHCIDMYADLRKLQKDPGAGILYVPGYQPIRALFTKLKANADATPEKILCTFEFTEENSASEHKPRKSIHTAAEGETLFDIAYICGLKVDELLKLNPQIRRPDEIAAGEKIKIC